MDDFYTEQLIKKQADSKDTLKKVGLIALTVVSVLLVFVIPVGIILPVVMIVIDVLMFRNLNVEYEYVFVNGDLDIDKIMNKARRKRMFSVDADQSETLYGLLEKKDCDVTLLTLDGADHADIQFFQDEVWNRIADFFHEKLK